jgi:hypothetical protein
MSPVRRTLAGLAIVGGALAPFAGSPYLPRDVDALQLASWIKDRKPGLRIFDPRPLREFNAYHIPASEHVEPEDLKTMHFRPTETVVVVTDDILRGWSNDVMNLTLAPDASPEAKAAFERAAAISRYFGGAPRIGQRDPTRVFRRHGC